MIILLFGWQAMAAENGFNPHQTMSIISGNHQQCLSCHKKTPNNVALENGQYLIPDMKHYVKDATAMCTDCHGNDESSHIVGVTPDYKVPADLPLDRNNRISCLTCHYTHGSLSSDKPMASASLMDRLFNRDRLTKSFVLRRNNAQGDLCLACHSQ